MEGPQPLSNLSMTSTNLSTLLNSTGTTRAYVFVPASTTTKLIILLLLVIVGTVGFVGNSLIYYFISSKSKRFSYLQSSIFVRNFNFYVKSLAISDMLSNTISLPLIYIQLMYDLFQEGWPCKTVRYLNMLFPSITMNNLIVISTEKYFSTRPVPRSFSVACVRRLVLCAWTAGFIIVIAPTFTFNGIRFDLNNTQYTVVCKIDNSYLPFRVIFVSYALLQHVIPSIILSYINISLMKIVWTRKRKRVTNIQMNNAIRAKLRAAKLRGTYLLIVITFAFIIPYSWSFYYATYVMVVKPSLEFQSDYRTRCLSIVVFFSNSTLNFIIYLVQMNDFRQFLKKVFCNKVR